MTLSHRILGIISLALSTLYIIWLYFHIIGVEGYILLTVDVSFGSLLILFLINHWAQEHQFHCLGAPEGKLDVFITVAREPIEIVMGTIRAACAIDYESKVVTVLDDGRHPDVERIAKVHGAHYSTREDLLHNKAGNLNHGLAHTNGEFILTLDADQVVHSTIARDLLGYFREDANVAIVTTRQSFDVPVEDFNHDHLFYNHMQAGKNADNAAISCGSGVFYRRSALEAIGRFQTWNLVEDLYTSYILHSHGYKSIYINRAYTIGTAPLNLKTIYKQRGTWALDTLRLFFKRSPLSFPGLTIKQRLHYFEMGWGYIIAALILPVQFLLPIINLLFNFAPVSDPVIYFLLRISSLLAILFFYYSLSGNTFIGSCYFVGLFPIYLRAFVLSFFPGKPAYHVTNKVTKCGEVEIAYILPQLAFSSLAIAVVEWKILVDHGISEVVLLNSVWIFLMLFWLTPIIKKDWVLRAPYLALYRGFFLNRVDLFCPKQKEIG